MIETEVETLRGINPPEPYRILVRIPNGMEYTGPNEEAETAQSKRIRADGAIKLDLANSLSSMAYVHHGSSLETGAHEPIVVEKAFD